MSRLNINKTYKLFIDGSFPRSESGRTYPIYDAGGKTLANVCSASRKDFRNAVVAARKAQIVWNSKTPFNRSQVLYRLAEMLESRKDEFINEIQHQGSSKQDATTEVEGSIDRLVYYAGWCDKYGAVFSSVNPIAASYFNFSVQEPTGVVMGVAPEDASLLGLVSLISPVLSGGNSIVLLATEQKALSAISFAEVVQNSDVPRGVINILTGSVAELWPDLASHMDVNAIVNARFTPTENALDGIAGNVKRYINWVDNWNRQDPYTILDFQELKTTWHPIQPGSQSLNSY